MKNCQLIFHAMCQFQFFRPPPKQTLTIFWGVIRKFLRPPHEKLLVDISYKIPVDWNFLQTDTCPFDQEFVYLSTKKFVRAVYQEILVFYYFKNSIKRYPKMERMHI